jgi:DNA-binding NarL/FixJ family response regulator
MSNMVLYSFQPVLSAGLEASLAASDGFRRCGAYSTLPQFMDRLTLGRPGLAALEITPDVTVEMLSEIRAIAVGATLVLWIDGLLTEFACQALDLGIRGILPKPLSAELRVRCSQKLAEGEMWVEKALSDRLLSAQRVRLTAQERELMGLIARGLKNREIAWSMGVGEGSVMDVLRRVAEKVGASGRLELALFARRNMPESGLAHTSPRRKTVVGPPLYAPGYLRRPMERKAG